MELNRWWAAVSGERFWLEITRRRDLGIDLRAPQARENGTPFWGYSLLREVRQGDVVFHYDQEQDAIVAASVAVGEPWTDPIVWAARGTSARKAGTTPHQRPGIYLALERYTPLSPTLSGDAIAARQPEIAAAYHSLHEVHGKPLYEPFTIYAGGRRLTPAQAYLTKLPAKVVDLFPSLSGVAGPLLGPVMPQVVQLPPSSLPGPSIYRAADEDASAGERDPFLVDPAAVERGLVGHARTQNMLARLAEEHGAAPRSPRASDPNFDVAWIFANQQFVCEVKSITLANEERQMRLGLGQVLRYRQLLGGQDAATAVLAVERQPTDPGWSSLCESVGVRLVWPDTMESLFTERAAE